jgi:hypothetical protein
VLGSAGGSSSLAKCMSAAVELLEGRIDVVATNRVCWGSRFALATAVSHFLELNTKLEMLGSGCSVDLTEDEADALWICRVACSLPVNHLTVQGSSGGSLCR